MPHDKNKGQSTPSDAVESARHAGLRYVSDEEPGIRRRRCGSGFAYIDIDGSTVPRGAGRERIEALVIPPAWQDVWICPREDGHIQATGRDEEGRKQYLYHPHWRAHRDLQKYRRLLDLGPRLPKLRRRIGRELRATGIDKTRVVAGAIRLLDRVALRVGSEIYAEENESFGITTLRKEHVRLDGNRVRLRFDGKSGIPRDVTLRDHRLSHLIKDLRRVPGESLFVFKNGENGATSEVQLRPDHVNDRLRDVLDCEVTSKDFRTWAGSVEVLCVLSRSLHVDESERDRVVLEAVDAAAELLGNLRSTAREFYVHPGLLAAYETGKLEGLIQRAKPAGSQPGLRRGEELFLAVLPELPDGDDEGS